LLSFLPTKEEKSVGLKSSLSVSRRIEMTWKFNPVIDSGVKFTPKLKHCLSRMAGGQLIITTLILLSGNKSGFI
jgi:hypothetical protein